MTESIHGLQYETEYTFCRPAVDSLALAAFSPAKDTVVDLCCGAGLIGLLLCSRNRMARVTGIDISPIACREAQRNAETNGLRGRFSALRADVRKLFQLPAAGSFEAAVANPPYNQADGMLSPDPARARALSEADCPLDAVCRAAARLVKTGGSFCIVYPAVRMPDLFETLRSTGFEPKRLQFIRHSVHHTPSLVLVDARRNGGVGLTFESDLILRNEDGSETEQYRAVCGR